VAGLIDPAGVADAGAFLARLLRLDPAAPVRLRPARAGVVTIWAPLPFGVLVTRALPAEVAHDVTVRGKDLLAALDAGTVPPPDDAAWRWGLPPAEGTVAERLPAAEIRRVAQAAAKTLQEAATTGVGGRAVGSRALRDALLDHVPITVTGAGDEIAVPQRLVQAVVRMGFLGDDPVEVRRVGSWVALAGSYGTAWHRPARAGLGFVGRT